tara:strand:+ start:195 stop:617 length:423 start_codon:yes stop_codon:yes gene_type:complete
MPIDYTNNVYDKIVSNLRKTIGGELSIPVRMDENKGASSILIQVVEDNLLEMFSSGQTREYSINLIYELNSGGLINAKNFKQVSNVAEHLKRLFAPDQNVLDGTDYYGARVNSITYEKDEEEPKMRAIIALTLISLEAVV